MAKDLDPTSLPPPLPALPAEVQTKIDTLKQEAYKRRQVLEWNDTVDHQMEEQQQEEEQKRAEMEMTLAEEYRKIRSTDGEDYAKTTFDDAVEEGW